MDQGRGPAEEAATWATSTDETMVGTLTFVSGPCSASMPGLSRIVL